MDRSETARSVIERPRASVDAQASRWEEPPWPSAFELAAALMQTAGYVLDGTTKHAYRFDRGRERVDLMCADRQSIFRHPKYDGRPLFGVAGGTRALQQTIDIDVVTAVDVVRLVVPTVRGALVLKGAAYLEDSRDRDRGRHAEDAVVLLACMSDASEVLLGLSQRSRGRL